MPRESGASRGAGGVADSLEHRAGCKASCIETGNRLAGGQLSGA